MNNTYYGIVLLLTGPNKAASKRGINNNTQPISKSSSTEDTQITKSPSKESMRQPRNAEDKQITKSPSKESMRQPRNAGRGHKDPETRKKIENLEEEVRKKNRKENSIL